MKSIYILTIYMALLIPTSQANLKALAGEFLEKNFGLIKAKTQIDVSKIALALENSKYIWSLSLGSALTDSELMSSSLSVTTQNVLSNSITFSKGLSWGGNFSLISSMDIYSGASDLRGFTQTFSYSQDLGKNLFGRQSRREIEIAQDSIEVAKDDYNVTKEKSLYSFSTTYLNASLLKSLLDYQAEAYQRALKRKNLIKRRVKDGLRENVDLLQAQNSLLQQEEELIIAENNLKDVLRSLSESLHRDVLVKEVSYLKYSKTTKPTGELVDNANLKLLEKKVTLLGKSLKNTQDERANDFSLSTSYKTNNYNAKASDAFSNGILGSDNNEISVALSYKWNIESGTSSKYHALKRIEKMNLVKEIEMEHKNLAIRDKAIIEKIKNLELVIETSQKRIILAKKTLKEYNSLYNKGRVDLDTVIRSEEGLINNQRSHTSRVSDHKQLVNGLLLLYGKLELNLMR